MHPSKKTGNIFSKLIKGEKGQVLPLVLILLVLGSTIMAGTLAYGSTSLKVSKINEDRAEQLNAADAGVRWALWKLTNELGSVPQVPGESEGYDSIHFNGFSDVNGKIVIVNIDCISSMDFNKTYRITSTAFDTFEGGSSTTVEVYTSKVIELWKNAATAGDTVDILGGGAAEPFIDGPIAPHYTGWPLNETALRDNYRNQVSSLPIDTSNTIDVSLDIDDVIDSLYTKPDSGTLDIVASTDHITPVTLGTTPPPPWGYSGTIYVEGDLTIGRFGSQPFTLDLNRNTIYVTGEILIDRSCTIIGSGCILAEGPITFMPSTDLSSPDDFIKVSAEYPSACWRDESGLVRKLGWGCSPSRNAPQLAVGYFTFVMSLYDANPPSEESVYFSPSGNFYGSVAGYINVNLQPNNRLILTEPPLEGLNFPTDGLDLTALWLMRSWKIERAAELGLMVRTTSLIDGEVNASYSDTLTALGGNDASYSWEVTNGSLPAGLTYDSGSGIISSTPSAITAIPTPKFTVTVTDADGVTASKELSIKIYPALIITTPSPLPDGTVGVEYSTTILATGGVMPYKIWSIAGVLPGGLSFDTDTQKITGTPELNTDGFYTVAITVTDSLNVSFSKNFDITISAGALAVTTNAPTGLGHSGSNYHATLNGNLTSLGQATSANVFFEYGPTTSYGTTVPGTPSSRISAGAFTAYLSGMTSGSVVHFRAIVIGNDGTTAYGLDQSFTN